MFLVLLSPLCFLLNYFFLSRSCALITPCPLQDEPTNLFVLETFLRGTPHSIEKAKDGRSAYQLFQQKPFDIIILDYVRRTHSLIIILSHSFFASVLFVLL